MLIVMVLIAIVLVIRGRANGTAKGGAATDDDE